MKMLLIHAWNEREKAYRGKFSNLLSYPSLTLATIYSLIPETIFTKIDVVDENSQKVHYDQDIKQELLSLPDQIEYLGLDICRFAMLTPYPGTKLFEEYDKAGRIATKDWSQYTQNNAVFEPVHMTRDELEDIYFEVWKRAFTWKKVLKRSFTSAWRFRPYVFILLGANIGFKYLGIKKRAKS